MPGSKRGKKRFLHPLLVWKPQEESLVGPRRDYDNVRVYCTNLEQRVCKVRLTGVPIQRGTE